MTSTEELTTAIKESTARELAELAKPNSLRVALAVHLASEACTPIETDDEFPDELESKKRRFLYSLAIEHDVRQDKAPHSLLAAARRLSLPSQFAILENARPGTEMHEMFKEIRSAGGPSKYIDAFEENITRVAESQTKMTVALRDDDFVEDGKFVKHESIKRVLAEQRAKGRKINQIVDRIDGEDPYLERLRTDANAAKLFISQGMPLPELTGDLSDEKKQLVLHEALETATIAISRYESERHKSITRRDGDPTRFVSLPDFETLYRVMNSGRMPLKKLHLQSWFGPQSIAAAIQTQAVQFENTLHNLPVLDHPLFVSRLVLLFSFMPMPPVVEFSRQLRILTAATLVVGVNVKGMTADQKVRLEKQLAKKAKAEKKESPNHFFTDPNSGQAPLNSQIAISTEEINASFERLRVLAQKEWRRMTSQLRERHALDYAYHIEKGTSRDVMLHTGFVPAYTDAQVAADRFVVTRDYLRKLWFASQLTCQLILRAYETRLLAQLGEFLNTADYEYWMQEPTFPESVHDHPLTRSLLRDNNANLASARTAITDGFRALAGYEETLAGLDLDPLDIPADEALLPIIPELPSSPTTEQMARYHIDNMLLFDLSPRQLAIVSKERR